MLTTAWTVDISQKTGLNWKGWCVDSAVAQLWPQQAGSSFTHSAIVTSHMFPDRWPSPRVTAHLNNTGMQLATKTRCWKLLEVGGPNKDTVGLSTWWSRHPSAAQQSTARCCELSEEKVTSTSDVNPYFIGWYIKAEHLVLRNWKARQSESPDWGGTTQRLTGLAGCPWRQLGWPSRRWGSHAAAATAACQRYDVCCGWADRKTQNHSLDTIFFFTKSQKTHPLFKLFQLSLMRIPTSRQLFSVSGRFCSTPFWYERLEDGERKEGKHEKQQLLQE